MNKCNSYPKNDGSEYKGNCDCYNKWVEPALKIVPEKEAEFFAQLIKEIENSCIESFFIENENFISLIEKYKELIPTQLTTLFSNCLMKMMLKFYDADRMPVPSDLKRIEIYLSQLFSKQPEQNAPTHREIIFAHQYKIKTGEAESKTAKEWQNERKGRAKLEFYTTVNGKNSKSFRPETLKELKTIIQLLEGFKAQKIAENNLDQLQNQ